MPVGVTCKTKPFGVVQVEVHGPAGFAKAINAAPAFGAWGRVATVRAPLDNADWAREPEASGRSRPRRGVRPEDVIRLRPHWTSLLGVMGLLLVAVVLIGLGVKDVVTTRRFLAGTSAADGVVVKVDDVTTSHKDGTTSRYYPVVRFVTGSGQVVQYRDHLGENSPAYRVGDPVRVLYDPANPQRARLDTWASLWLEAMILLMIGVPLLFVSAVILLFARVSPRVRTGQKGKASVHDARRPPTPPRSAAEPNQPPHRAEGRPQDSKTQDE